jgi:hypothetical protein
MEGTEGREAKDRRDRILAFRILMADQEVQADLVEQVAEVGTRRK